MQIKYLVLLATLLLGTSQVVLARNSGAPSAGGHTGSTERAANANSPTSADRDKGQARAEDRRSEEGAEHNKQGAPKKRVKKSFKKKPQ